FTGVAGTATGDNNQVTLKIYSGSTATGTPVQTLTVNKGAGGAYTTPNAATLADGTYTAQASQTDTAGNTGFSSANTFVVDTVRPSVTVNQASGQADPTNQQPVNFTATFSEPVTGFVAADVTVGGTAPGTPAVAITGGPSAYNIAVSGRTGSGTVTAAIAKAKVTDLAGNHNNAST